MELGEPEQKRFTRDELRRMIDAGVFGDDEHLELIHGRLVVVPPQGAPHSYSSTILRERLTLAYARVGFVREDKPLDCGIDEVTEPDVAVVRGAPIDYAARDPRGDETMLVVEVSRSTQTADRAKASIYASAGVPVYWLLDLAARRAEVHTTPTAGDRYALVRVVGIDDRVEVPGTSETWLVRDLLPPEQS